MTPELFDAAFAAATAWADDLDRARLERIASADASDALAEALRTERARLEEAAATQGTNDIARRAAFARLAETDQAYQDSLARQRAAAAALALIDARIANLAERLRLGRLRLQWLIACRQADARIEDQP